MSSDTYFFDLPVGVVDSCWTIISECAMPFLFLINTSFSTNPFFIMKLLLFMFLWILHKSYIIFSPVRVQPCTSIIFMEVQNMLQALEFFSPFEFNFIWVFFFCHFFILIFNFTFFPPYYGGRGGLELSHLILCKISN